LRTPLSNVTLPATFSGYFRAWLYIPSHNQLLLRSTDPAHGENTDIVFSGVKHMHIRTGYDGLVLREADESHILPEGASGEPAHRVILVDPSGQDYLICEALRVGTNTLGTFEVEFPVPF
jgi:hypothetical protein